MTALFGKVSDSPEFVREGSFGEPEAALEDALLGQVERGHATLPSRFLVAGAGYARIGAWIPSEDAVGREFPLAVSIALPVGTLLSIVPLHYGELLAAATEALNARRQGTRGAPYLTPPHPSLLLPRVHGARTRLVHEPAKSFERRAFGSGDGDPLLYALATLLRAAELTEPVALRLPSAREEDLFAWLEVLGTLAPTHVLSLVWSGADALLGRDMELADLLACERSAWPLTSELPDARTAARDRLGEALASAVERDCAMAVVLEELAKAARCARAS